MGAASATSQETNFQSISLVQHLTQMNYQTNAVIGEFKKKTCTKQSYEITRNATHRCITHRLGSRSPPASFVFLRVFFHITHICSANNKSPAEGTFLCQRSRSSNYGSRNANVPLICMHSSAHLTHPRRAPKHKIYDKCL